jgi:hypothetical protein
MGKFLSLLSLLRHFFVSLRKFHAAVISWLVLRGWLRPEVEGIGSEPYGQGRAKFPGCYLGDSAKP